MNYEKREKVHLIVFIIVALVIGWVGVQLNNLLGQEQAVESLGSLVWLVTPLFLSIIIRTIEKDWKHSSIKPNFKGNGKLYALSILIFPAIMIILLAIAFMAGLIEKSKFSWGLFLPVMCSSVGANFFKNISEEFSWRMYLTQKLVAFRCKDWQVYLVTGLVWNLWHSAYYMVFLPDDLVNMSQRITLVTWGCVVLTIWSILFGEIYRLTNSVWPCVLMHAIEDGVVTTLMITSGIIQLKANVSFIMEPTTGIISLLIMLGVAIWLRKIRCGRQKCQSKAAEI